MKGSGWDIDSQSIGFLGLKKSRTCDIDVFTRTILFIFRYVKSWKSSAFGKGMVSEEREGFCC